MTRTIRLFAPCCALLILATGCVQGADYARPDVLPQAPGSFVRAPDGTAPAPAVAQWWSALGDPLLDDLIAQGLAHAPGIDAALARVRQARSGISAAQAANMPALSASTTFIHTDLPGDVLSANRRLSGDMFNTGFDAQWEIDLWGGGQRNVERSKAMAEAADATLADARVALAAEIARNYVTLRARQVSTLALEGGIPLRTRILRLEEQRRAQGASSDKELEDARAELAMMHARVDAAHAEITMLKDALAVLTGQEPGAMGTTLDQGGAPENIPLPPAEVAIGDVASLLQHRPDIRRAERELAAASARIGMEKAQRFPQISFLGLVGLGGPNAGDMFESGPLNNVAMPRLSWSFLDFGRGAAAVRGSEAARDAALADYKGKVLSALQDAEAALTRYGASRTIYQHRLEAAAHHERIYQIAIERAEAGTDTRIAMERTYVARSEVWVASVNARADLTLAYIALAKALGTGWDAPTGS